MGRPPLSIAITSKDQKELAKLWSGGVQQVRIVLRALALLQLAEGVSAPQMAKGVPLTSQAIRNIGRRYQQAVGNGHCMKDRGRVQRKCSTKARNNVCLPWYVAVLRKDEPVGRCAWWQRKPLSANWFRG